MTLETRRSGHSREQLPATSTRGPLEPLLTSKEVAALLQVSASTLCRWRDHHDGPPWINLGGIPRYRAHDLARWTESQLQK
jgi:predicted DNA-binding transcriptional regulator AlpA